MNNLEEKLKESHWVTGDTYPFLYLGFFEEKAKCVLSEIIGLDNENELVKDFFIIHKKDTNLEIKFKNGEYISNIIFHSEFKSFNCTFRNNKYFFSKTLFFNLEIN